MKLTILLAATLTLLAPSNFAAGLTVQNDGTTTANLTLLTVADPAASGTLTPNNGVLLAAQTGTPSGNAAVRNAWLLNSFAPTSGVYSVAADFLPDPDNAGSATRGGVLGWLSLDTKAGLGLQVVPGDSGFFQLTTVDFSATDESAAESFTNLFNLDGSAASSDASSAVSDLGAYAATNVASFQLDFTAPTAADLLAVTNATAHVSARVFQVSGGTTNQVGRTIELLTTLPAPAATNSKQRVGYYAFWGSFFQDGGTIGTLDNLSLSDGFTGVANTPPTVTLTAPANNAAFITPVDILLTADAHDPDPDGSIARVDFYAGTTLVGTSTQAPYSATWTNAPAGNYAITARATDNLGGVTGSSPAVNISVAPPAGSGPTLTIELLENNVIVSWPLQSTGYTLQSTGSLGTPSWTPYTALNNSATIANSGNLFFRLIKAQ